MDKFLKRRGWTPDGAGWWHKQTPGHSWYYPTVDAIWHEYNEDKKLLALLGRVLQEALPTASVVAALRIEGLLSKISQSLFGREFRPMTLAKRLKELL